MPRLINRIASLLLIPCLLGDPSMAVGLAARPPQMLSVHAHRQSSAFDEQALEPVTLWMHRALETVRTAPHIRVMASLAATGVAVAAAMAYPHMDPTTFWRGTLWAATGAFYLWLWRTMGVPLVPFGLMAVVPPNGGQKDRVLTAGTQ